MGVRERSALGKSKLENRGDVSAVRARSEKGLFLPMRPMTSLLFLLSALLLSGCWWQEAATPTLYPADYAHLPGWESDQHSAALGAFEKSCASREFEKRPFATVFSLTGGRALRVTSEDFVAICRQLPAKKPLSPDASESPARTFFETAFMPYLLTRDGYPAGLVTGYYAPVLHGAMHPSARFRYPVYGLPPEVGKSPADTTMDRAAIDAGALTGRGLELLWVDDPVMLFFLHVQGSGYVQMPDGSRVQLRYAGKNGMPYVSIGRVLAEQGLIPLEQVTMPSIRAWLREHPEKQSEIFAQNPSYVFFTLEKNAPPILGAQGVALTPSRSLAVDNTIYPYGMPIFLTTAIPANDANATEFWQRLMIAQDTGGAIRGPLRADIFFGEGLPAEAKAGRMNSPGSFVLLVPRRAVERSHAAP